MDGPILAIDQGPTYTRAVIYGPDRRILGAAHDDLRQLRPAPDWLTQDPEEIWNSVLAACRTALMRARIEPDRIAAIGIAAQRETTILWERDGGKPVYPAICSEDRRSASRCKGLRDAGVEAIVRERTGLRIDPCFPATKLSWMLDHVDGVRELAEAGKLAFGTVESFLLWRLTAGRIHATDVTNASRTLLFDIKRQRWDDALLRIFDIPRSLLPTVQGNAAYFGDVNAALFGGSGTLAVRSLIAHDQAGFVGQGCFSPGASTATYAAGCTVLVNIGDLPIPPPAGVLTTIAYRIEGAVAYALEGLNFSTSVGPAWIVDGLGTMLPSDDVAALAEQSDPYAEVYFIPPSLGRGAPHWAPASPGAIVGVEATTRAGDLARAALESIGYQTRDLFDAIGSAWPMGDDILPVRVDGRHIDSAWTMQFLADVLGRSIELSSEPDPVSLGTAWLAGMELGTWSGPGEFAASWRHQRRYEPQMSRHRRDEKHAGWRAAVRQTIRSDES